MDKGLRFNMQRVGDAVNVVEIGDHLGGVMDGAIGKAVVTQFIEIGSGHGSGGGGHFDRIGAEGAIRRRQRGRPPVGGNVMDKAIGCRFVGNAKIGDLSPEVVGVGTASVEAVIVRRDHGCQQLPLAATEGRFTVHERAIHVH